MYGGYGYTGWWFCFFIIPIILIIFILACCSYRRSSYYPYWRRGAPNTVYVRNPVYTVPYSGTYPSQWQSPNVYPPPPPLYSQKY
uniref:Uncharacterized protein n=1 Tax=Acrobeloides nanus TaxID=290746 RepID=A0A914DEU5_9BILA